jgi:hypothetical protein
MMRSVNSLFNGILALTFSFQSGPTLNKTFYRGLPTNSPFNAVAGDLIRVGATLRVAEQHANELSQKEFDFSSK